MKKIGKAVLVLVVIDYIRTALAQTYYFVKRYEAGDSFWTAWRKVAPHWRDKVVFYEELEEEV